ncbi:Fic family protein [bacterium]|nr:Fic family protein [bacterium]
MTDQPDSLATQLEKTRLERALGISASMAEKRVLMTTTELARLNNILMGSTEDPWREGTISLTLASGKVETFSMIADPKQSVREKLHRATEQAEAGNVVDAAVDIYVGLVLTHPFNDANRRTAVVAAEYFLRRYGVPLSGVALHEIGLGDIRDKAQVQNLRDTVKQMAKFITKR